MDLVGALPGPPNNKSNKGAADLLEAELFAYGLNASVAVVEVGSTDLKVRTALTRHKKQASEALLCTAHRSRRFNTCACFKAGISQR